MRKAYVRAKRRKSDARNNLEPLFRAEPKNKGATTPSEPSTKLSLTNTFFLNLFLGRVVVRQLSHTIG